ncbi:MAG TPA: F0F1 ATP synthase subunit B [Candidatus Saccharimonadales bacterium]|nr:F0F1 ATP synthase subunit B [Candidatus Saccharimonadales bacterium]
MLLPLIQFAESSSSPAAALGLSLQSYLIQLGTFIVAFLVLRQWAFKPIMKALHDRRKTIEEGLLLGEQMRAKEVKLEEDVAHRLRQARAEADRILAMAETEAKQAVQNAEEVTRKRTDKMLKDAEEQIKQTTLRERARLEKEIVGLVSEVSESIIGEKVDARKDAALIDKALKERRAA